MSAMGSQGQEIAQIGGQADVQLAPFVSVTDRVRKIEASLIATLTSNNLKQETIAKL